MRKVFVLGALGLLGACAQFSTNDAERAALQARVDQQAAAFLDCVRREAGAYLGSSTDAAFVYDALAGSCAADLDTYKAGKTELLETEVMLTSKPLEAAVADLNQQARGIIAAAMAGGGAAAAAPGMPAATPAAAAAVAAAPAPLNAAPAGGWTPEQRVYLDCMVEQAKRYSSLSESAATIAEVAQNNCRSYLTGSNPAALAQEGRALVLNQVFEARVSPRR